MLTPGTTLQNRYRIHRQIGGGGMGVVYLAEDTRLAGRRCAIKEVSPAELAPQDRSWATNAFRQEAQMLANLDHPGLTAVTDFFFELGNWYLVMDFVVGETLGDRLDRLPDRRLPLREALDITRQLCTVLEYLHGQRPPVVFRDLKPGNVMLTPEGKIKLIDFGIARFFKPGRSRDTVNLGTPGYAAPEQYGGKGQTDPRSDIYSLGVLLHEVLTGYDPQATPFNLPRPRSLAPTIPLIIEQVILRATQPDPDARYRNVDQFRRALPRSRVVDVFSGWVPWVVIGASVLAVGAALVLGLLLGQMVASGTPSPTPVPTVARLTRTPRPSAAPTPIPTPTAQLDTVTVQPGETLYQVCQRYCAGKWPSDSVEVNPELKTYAEKVARINGISWEIPVVNPGQVLQMPPCP
ncbi:MAG: protein kinase [Anaerolineae bacterium]|nr:protein kinase [Anaerolineae bacterium]